MANEFKHASVGTELTQAEYEGTASHVLDSQAAGDIIYASSTTQLSRLGIGTAGKVLHVNSGASAPEWTAALTGVTSIHATDLIIGEDSQTAIDFGTVNEIDFKVDNANRLTLTTSALYPETDNQIDLGTSSLEFKDAFFDGTVTSDAFAGPLTGDVTGNADTATALATARAINGVNFDGTAAITITAAGSTLSDTVTVAKGGTGATSLTDGGILLGSGTSAITATAVLGDGEMLVGDGSGDPAIESGATLRTSIGLGSVATRDTGISNNNIPIFTSGAADNDFLRIDGTAIEGLSASEVLSEIGAQASLTFGISNTNAVKIDSASVADDEYARFTANGLESRSTSEVLSDISAAPAAGDGNIVTVGALDSGSITSGFTSIDVGSGAITTTGTVSAGIVDITSDAHLDSSPGNNTVSGITATFTAGEALQAGEAVYYKASDSKMHKAVAAAGSVTPPCIALAAENLSADATGKFLLVGFIRNDDDFPTYTAGDEVYTPEAETSSQNVPEAVAPDSDGDLVQVLGIAIDGNTLFFNPSLDVIEHA